MNRIFKRKWPKDATHNYEIDFFGVLNLNSLCVSHEVNFPSTVHCPRRCRPVLRHPYCHRLG